MDCFRVFPRLAAVALLLAAPPAPLFAEEARGPADPIAKTLPAHAEVTLRGAVERAWARQPSARAEPARSEEFAAKREAAQALFPEPPSFSVSNRDDRFHRDNGAREWEAEIALPLWLPGEKARQTSIVDAERDQYHTGLTAAKLKIAGEVRDAYWQVRLAENELALARRKAEEGAALAADVERRVKAGDLARVDLNQAQAAERLARAALTEAEIKAFKARQAFEVLTSASALPAAEESVAPAGSGLDGHYALVPLQRAVVSAQAKLRQATQSLRNNPEIDLAARRERGVFDEPYVHSFQLRFRLPFATDARNKPRIAAANAEMIEAQAAYGVERAKVAAEIEAARRELEQTRTVARLTEARFALATDTQRLLAKAFALGELDLVARLRAENERFDAELNFTRTQLEAARAVSRLNQALGVLP
jgi:cobalt-zinc-cadmium efflux system outer membrane protein